MYSKIEELYEKSLTEDMGAKEELLLRLRPAIISSIKSYYNRYNQYDDLIQEGYEVILRCMKDYDPGKGAYLLGYIKLTLKFHYLNKHKATESTVSLNQELFTDDGIELIDTIADDSLSQEEKTIRKEELHELYTSLLQLTNRQRDIVTLYYIEEKPLCTIANIYGISYRTVVNTRITALNKLKKLMTENII
ncbi:sigma-70 family RNA polymerase sigma factor [Brassicibacter mesophilus]|uniref:sigma-70 family RNA polymerase sigma factor n=1 Tax=Brassicibacter mesophilus TaxID=745119 RepID=UPI003D259D04